MDEVKIGAIFKKDTADSDGDGLSNYDELALYSSDPNSVDGDSDGYTDVEEIAAGRDPSDASNFPNEAPVIADQEFKITEGLIDVAAVLATDSNKEDTQVIQLPIFL